ncbi:MAG TPA: protein-disulfide reductase DsbD N-terminal domain-containing protein, partial [Pyrinomonadaceae bacterium]|nr:protein-disulfide reductase DsbD N-terminal domain-containing protein [Pyrinomonadaceae bacterium]
MFRVGQLKIFIILSFIVLALPAILLAQNPTKWSLESDVKGKTLKSGETFKTELKAEIEEGWHLYAVEQPQGGPFPTKITVGENTPFQIDGNIKSPQAITKFDPNFQIETKFFDKQAGFVLPIKANSEANTNLLAINVRFQVCNDTLCLPPKTVKVTFAGFEDVKKSATQQTPVIESQPPIDNQTAAQNGERQTAGNIRATN